MIKERAINKEPIRRLTDSQVKILDYFHNIDLDYDIHPLPKRKYLYIKFVLGQVNHEVMIGRRGMVRWIHADVQGEELSPEEERVVSERAAARIFNGQILVHYDVPVFGQRSRWPK